MELLTSPQAWIAFATLTGLELVLGIDNIIFISLLVDKLPPDAQAVVRAQQQRLHDRLTEVMQNLGTTPDAIVFPKITGTDPTATTDLPHHSPYGG